MPGLIGPSRKNEKTPLPAPFVPDPGAAAFRPWAAPARAAGLLGRIRNLRSEDLACIIVGCVMLLSGPLVERWSSSSGEASALEQGFATFDSAFPDPDSENGLLGLTRESGASGAPVVTPLNAADPSGLIVAPEGMFGVAEKSLIQGVDRRDKKVAPPPAEKKSGGWRDALDAAKRGIEPAARSAGLPSPSKKIQGTLRGLAALSGGSGAKSSAPSLSAPSGANLFSSPRVRDSMSLSQAIPGYMGPAARGLSRGSGLSKGNLELAAQRAGSFFNQGGGTLREAVDSATFLNGGFRMDGSGEGEGEAGKAGGVNSSKDQKTFTEKETLAQMKARLEMQKAIDLKWEKKKYEELDRMKMREQIIAQTLAQTAQQVFMKVFSAAVDKLFGIKSDRERDRETQNVSGAPVQFGAPVQ